MATPVDVTSGVYSEAQRAVEVYKDIMLGGISVSGVLVVPAVVPEANAADIEAATNSLMSNLLSTLNSAAPAELTLQNSWVNYGGVYAKASYRRDPFGNVMLSGLIKNGTTAPGTVLATLPQGARPSGTELFIVQTAATHGRVDINNLGQIVLVSGSASHLSLSGISFYSGG